jgi:hypothetical protein
MKHRPQAPRSGVDAALSGSLGARVEGLIGAVQSTGGRASKAHERYGEILKTHKAKIRKTQPRPIGAKRQ